MPIENISLLDIIVLNLEGLFFLLKAIQFEAFPILFEKDLHKTIFLKLYFLVHFVVLK